MAKSRFYMTVMIMCLAALLVSSVVCAEVLFVSTFESEKELESWKTNGAWEVITSGKYSGSIVETSGRMAYIINNEFELPEPPFKVSCKINITISNIWAGLIFQFHESDALLTPNKHGHLRIKGNTPHVHVLFNIWDLPDERIRSTERYFASLGTTLGKDIPINEFIELSIIYDEEMIIRVHDTEWNMGTILSDDIPCPAGAKVGFWVVNSPSDNRVYMKDLTVEKI